MTLFRRAWRVTVGELRVDLAYTVRGTNSRYNFVFPFYLKEATHPEL